LLAQIGRRYDFRKGGLWDQPEISTVSSRRDRLPSALPISFSVIIVGLCMLVSLASLVFPGSINNYLVLYPISVLEKPWTLITYMFVHANFDHLLWNMLFLFFFGLELERRVGERMFLAIYMLSGVVAALGQMVLTSGPMVGASGALYGVMGALAIIAPEIRVLLFFILPLRIQHAVVVFALIDFLSLGAADSIAHMAHILGLVMGLAFGYALAGRQKRYYY